MWSPIDEKQMIEDAGEFDRLYGGLRDSEESNDSGDGYLGTLPSMKTEMNNNQDNDASCSVASTTVKHEEPNVSSGVGAVREEPLRERHTAQLEKIMKSVVGEDFEKMESDPPDEVRKRNLLRGKMSKQVSTEREDCFNKHAPEVTEKLENELDAFKMSGVLIHKQLCKKNAMKTLPQYIQVGAVVESSIDCYSSHIRKKQKRQTMVEELLTDDEYQQHFNKIIETQKKARHHENNEEK